MNELLQDKLKALIYGILSIIAGVAIIVCDIVFKDVEFINSVFVVLLVIGIICILSGIVLIVLRQNEINKEHKINDINQKRKLKEDERLKSVKKTITKDSLNKIFKRFEFKKTKEGYYTKKELSVTKDMLNYYYIINDKESITTLIKNNELQRVYLNDKFNLQEIGSNIVIVLNFVEKISQKDVKAIKDSAVQEFNRELKNQTQSHPIIYILISKKMVKFYDFEEKVSFHEYSYGINLFKKMFIADLKPTKKEIIIEKVKESIRDQGQYDDDYKI